MTGPPRFTSATTQSGIVGENVHINCAAISVPQPQKGEIKWIFHETEINEDNSHYRIINSAIQHGIRSTLVIRESLKTDFGTYKCSIKNAHGTKELQIRLQQKKAIPSSTYVDCNIWRNNIDTSDVDHLHTIPKKNLLLLFSIKKTKGRSKQLS